MSDATPSPERSSSMGSPAAPDAGGGSVAIVEVGSGSVKLLVTDADTLAGGGPDPVRRSVKTRLWAGDGDGATFSPESLDRTAAAFRTFAADIDRAGPVAAVSVVGTAATRQVADVEPLDRLCREILDAPLEVLSGDREGQLGFAGAVAGRDLPWPRSLIDIGAGSTELSTGASAPGDGASTIRVASLPIGARVITDAYLLGDPPDPAELSSALSVAELHYDDLRRDLPELRSAVDAGVLLGTGAVGDIAAVEIGLADPDDPVDGYRLTKPAVEEVFRALATESAEDRAHNPGLKPEHVDDVVGSLCVLVEFLRRYDVEELVVSERGIRHGRAAELLATN